MSSMFPHTVTLYNVDIVVNPDLSETTVNHITILRGVLLDASKAINVRTSGLEGADAVNLYIPYCVSAEDGVTRRKKRYVGPREFWMAEDKTDLWTLQPSNSCFFVKGESIDATGSFEKIGLEYDDVYVVTKVDDKDFGRLKHWQVGGA